MRLYRDDSSGSDDGDTVTFIVGASGAGAADASASHVGSGVGAGIPIANVALHGGASALSGIGAGGRLHNYASLSSLASSSPATLTHGGYAHQNHFGDRSVSQSIGVGSLGSCVLRLWVWTI